MILKRITISLACAFAFTFMVSDYRSSALVVMDRAVRADNCCITSFLTVGACNDESDRSYVPGDCEEIEYSFKIAEIFKKLFSI